MLNPIHDLSATNHKLIISPGNLSRLIGGNGPEMMTKSQGIWPNTFWCTGRNVVNSMGKMALVLMRAEMNENSDSI